MMVTVLARSGLTKAYVSVLSATGSLLMAGASRWVDISLTPCSAGRVDDSAHQRLVLDRDLALTDDDGELAAAGVAHVGDHRAFGQRARRRLGQPDAARQRGHAGHGAERRCPGHGACRGKEGATRQLGHADTSCPTP